MMNHHQSYQGCGYQNQNRPGCGMNPSCGQPTSRPAPSCQKQEPQRKPAMTRVQLLNYINEVSFAKDEMLLYLDTHPCDKEALAFCRKHVEMRNKALKEYAKHYGPLTIDCTDDVASDSWEWVMQPWPWEGGAC